MTTNEFNSVLSLYFSPTSEYNKSRKIGPFIIFLSEEKNILIEGRIPFSLLLEISKKVPSLKYNSDDFSSPELDNALRHFNFLMQFTNLDHKSYQEKYDIYLKEELENLISTGNTYNLIIKKLSISSSPVELFNLLKCLKSYYSE